MSKRESHGCGQFELRYKKPIWQAKSLYHAARFVCYRRCEVWHYHYLTSYLLSYLLSSFMTSGLLAFIDDMSSSDQVRMG